MADLISTPCAQTKQTSRGDTEPASDETGPRTVATPRRRAPGSRPPPRPGTPASEVSDQAGGENRHEEYVAYVKALNVLICMKCSPRRGLGPGREQLEGHFSRQHATKKRDRGAILSFSYTFTELNDPRNMELPADWSEPVAFGEEGPVMLDGFYCRDCRARSVNKHFIARSHACTGQRSWEHVKLQTLTPGGGQARYWVVRGKPGRGPGAEPRVRGPHAALEARLGAYEEKHAKEQDEVRRTVDGRRGPDFRSTWVGEMGWAKHMAGADMTKIYAASRRAVGKREQARLRDAERDEHKRLILLRESFDREMSRCSGRMGRVPRESLRWLASVDANQPAARPFGLKQEAETMERYRAYMERYLCYCSRAFGMGRRAAADENRVRFTDEQWSALEALVAALDRTFAANSMYGLGRKREVWWRGEGDDDDDDDEEDEEDDDAGEGEYCEYNAARYRQGVTLADAGAGDEEDGVEGPRSMEEAELDERVFRFCVVSLKQKVAVNVFQNPLVHFTAVLAIDGVRRSWREARNFTPILAGLVWCARVIMLEHLFEDDDCDDPDDMKPETVERFMEGHRMWLADGSHTPFSTMIRDMTYGKAHRSKEGGTPRVMWEGSGLALRYLGQRIELGKFRRAAMALVDSAEEKLDKLMFGRWSSHARDMVRLDQIVDSLVFEGPGHSFATSDRNSWLRPGPRLVAEFGYETLWDARSGRWRPERVRTWLKTLHSFRLAMNPGMHVGGGFPGRGPESQTLRWCDTQDMPRSVFVFDGQVMIITDRDKYKALRGIGRKVARFLTERMGKLTVALIAWLSPFEKFICQDAGIQGPSAKLEPWLWKDARQGMWRTEVLTKQLRATTAEHMGVALGAADYRHVVIELGRRITGLAARLAEVDMMEGPEHDNPTVDAATGEERKQRRLEFVSDLQSTHGSVVAQRHYAVNVEFPGQLPPEMIANYREISRLWHRFLEEPDPTDTPNATPGRGTGGGASSTVGGPKRSHGESECSCGQDSPEKRRKVAREAIAAHSGKSVGEIERKMDRGLRSLFGDGSRWRSDEQRDCTRWALTKSSGEVLIAVLPTGGGKSTLFMVPSMPGMNAGVSIVVVPYVALMEDIVSRSLEAGIDCFRWLPSSATGRDEQARVAALVVVSADQVMSHEFISYADGLLARGLLKRIFVDECHTIITEAGFREKLGSLKGLYRYAKPVILLTATLPARLERWFRKVMVAGDAEIIRASTVKRNIRYEVVTVDGRTTVEDAVAKRVSEMVAGMTGDQKGIVYCRSIRACEELAAILGCECHHSKMDEAAKNRALSTWAEGKSSSRWITATTGLGTGIDIRGITAVIHAGWPYGLVDFIQQTGRGGRRDGERVESVVVVERYPGWRNQHGSDIEQENREALDRFVNSAECRRVTIGAFMDGVGHECDVLGAERCDRCTSRREVFVDGFFRDRDTMNFGDEGNQGTSAAVCNAVDRLQLDTSETQRRVAGLFAWLDEAAGRCAGCYMTWACRGMKQDRRRNCDHLMGVCEKVRKAEYMDWRRRITFAEGSCCWRCGLPERWCERYKDEGGAEVCQWMDMVLPVVYRTSRTPEQRDMMGRKFDLNWFGKDEAGYLKWLGRKRQMLGVEMTNAVAVWVELVEAARRGGRRSTAEGGAGH